MSDVEQPCQVAVVTIAAGRHEHLRGQRRGLLASRLHPDVHVVVAMADPELHRVVAEVPTPWRSVVVDVEVPAPGQLPLARARNLAVEAALAAGADLVVCLDVDCIPSPTLVGRYAAVASRTRAGAPVPSGPALLCGEVHYLPPPPGTGPWPLADLAHVARPHPARPRLADGELRPAQDLQLFWSLSFAVTPQTWQAVGGFDEAYVGYGGEDTDFVMRAQRAGAGMWWVGGAMAYHQHHPNEMPPVRHLAAVVRNANLFHDRWGWYPMQGWLAAFEAANLAREDPDQGRWVLTPAPPPAR